MRNLIILIEQAQKWPLRIEGWELASDVQNYHYEPEDFYEGDIQYNIESFGYYDLRNIPISTLDIDGGVLIDDDRVEEYSSLNPESAPPIVYDPIHNRIIDGYHRANAASMRGEKTISAYVGDASSYNPPDDDDDGEWRPGDEY